MTIFDGILQVGTKSDVGGRRHAAHAQAGSDSGAGNRAAQAHRLLKISSTVSPGDT